jgi:curli biogenesis system outer membrane secretion channel CsgG
MKNLAILVTCMMLGYGLAYAQEKAPTLTVEQKQSIQIKAQEMTIAQLQFDKAKAELTALLASLQKDGYDLDLQSMSYVKKKEPKGETEDVRAPGVR